MSHYIPSSSGQIPIPPPPSAIAGDQSSDPYARLSFAPASQAQILRAHQRDTSQIHRLIELSSELIRSFAGTRWLAREQTIVDLAIRATYLFLTFGRGAQTLGEEYTDILPYSSRRRRTPSRRRRFLTILFLLLPSILVSPSAIARLRSAESNSSSSSLWSKSRRRMSQILESPLGQTLPEIHMVAFMLWGRFFEIGKRLAGISYISTLPARPPEQPAPSYEPLGMMLLLPILYRFFQCRQPSIASLQPLPTAHQAAILPMSPPLTPSPTPQETNVLSKPASYDTSNTYLAPPALILPERQCTLCLEPRGTGEDSGGTVAVTECGHVFCWGCLGGLEKPECPLCRQTLRMERLVAAYNL